jgi:uncharacterized protein DUF4136
MKHLALAGILLVLVAPIAAQTPKYGVTVTSDKNTDFSKFKTYTWEHGWQAYDKSVHEQITAGVDRELAAIGLTRQAAEPSDLLVTYASLRRIDVDLNSKATVREGGRKQYDVGTLVVLLLEPGTRKELYRARVDKPIEGDPEKMKAVLDSAIAEMFAKYPTRARK